MFEQFLATAKLMWGTNGMIVYPLESSKLSASFQEFLQSLRESTKETFNSYPGTFDSNKLALIFVSIAS